MKDRIKDIFLQYRRQRDDMASKPMTAEHPNGDFKANTHLCGKPHLMYVALMNIADTTGKSSQEMIDRIIIRGITNEFVLWRSAMYENRIEQVVGK